MIALFAMFVVMVNDPPSLRQPMELLYYFIFTLTPAITLFAIHRCWGQQSTRNSSWLSLYFQRKSLEEKKRIRELGD